MTRAEAFRQIVVARAAGACEFCRLLQLASGTTFHLEHFHPQSRGGKSILANLALSCPSYLAKSNRTEGVDRSGRRQRLYNPCDYEPSRLGWYLHFELEVTSGIVLPRSATGEATIDLLRMNDELRVFARRLQLSAGLIG